MDQNIRFEIINRLKSDYRMKEASGDWLRQGKCPNCSGKELYIKSDHPYMLRCGRLNKCGMEWSTKELYSDLFDNWSNRFKQTAQDPHAAAKAYLRDARGLNIANLSGAYSQELYQDYNSQQTSATVRFPMPCHYGEGFSQNGQLGYWERIIDRPYRFGKKKANMPKGWSYRGHIWFSPKIAMNDLAQADEIWFAEGIFDAASFNQAFIKGETNRLAVSTLSTNNYPSAFLAALSLTIDRISNENGGIKHRPTLIFAFDVGAAGVSFARKYVSRARDEGWQARAAQVKPDGEGHKYDWNDLLGQGKLTPDNLIEYLENGDITTAETAAEKAFLLYRRSRRASFPFIFKTRQLWARFSAERINELVAGYDEDKTIAALSTEEKFDMAARESVEVSEIANCTFQTLYYQRDIYNPKQSSYYLRVDFPGKQLSVKANFPGNTMLKEGAFTDQLISVAPGAIFDGTTNQLKTLMKRQNADIRTVDALYFSGYSIKHKAWMFDEIAVSNGRVIDLNDEDFFEIGAAGVKPNSATNEFKIIYDQHNVNFFWWQDYHTAFGDLGTVTLAFWFVSMFAEQIRHKQQRLGFLEITGEAGGGKSTMLMFLWKLTGRLMNYEGFDPMTSTAAGIARELVKYGNLPVVMLEGDHAAEKNHVKNFDWNELKKIYNGHPPKTRGVANGGTDTFSPRFIGSLIIAQNNPIRDVDTPILSRIMALHVDKSRFTPQGKTASQIIEHIEVDDVSGWIIHIIKQEKKILEYYETRFTYHEKRLLQNPEILDGRLAFNHAQLAAGLDCLTKAMTHNGQNIITDAQANEAHNLITTMCVERHSAIQGDHPLVDQFWQKYDEMQEHLLPDRTLNLHRKDNYIAINMPKFERELSNKSLMMPTNSADMQKLLLTSKSRKFIKKGTTNCSDGVPRFCWIFEKPKKEIVIDED